MIIFQEKVERIKNNIPLEQISLKDSTEVER